MTNSVKEEKQNYRERARQHRDRMDIDETDYETVIGVFFDYFKPQKNQIIAAYWPSGREFDCRFLLDELVKQGFQCALPVIQPDTKVMKFAKWSHNTPMQQNRFGIEEPQSGEFCDPDMILAPLLAFDQKGYRLGQGGGYFDATLYELKSRNKSITYIGIGFAEQAVLLKLPREEHDIPMDYMLTPDKVIEF